MAVNVDSLPDSTAEIVRVLVQYLHIAPINVVLWLFGMLSHRGCGVARSFMLPYPGSESTLRFTNIGRRTFLAVELVNNTRFVHSFDFILGGHKLLPDGVNWLVMGADALILINTGNSLRDALNVGDYLHIIYYWNGKNSMEKALDKLIYDLSLIVHRRKQYLYWNISPISGWCVDMYGGDGHMFR